MKMYIDTAKLYTYENLMEFCQDKLTDMLFRVCSFSNYGETLAISHYIGFFG